MRWAAPRSQTTTRKPGHLPPSTILASRPTALALLAPPMEGGNAIRQSPQREERQQGNLGVRGNLAALAVASLDAMARKPASAGTKTPVKASDARRSLVPNIRNSGTDACFPMFGKSKR